MQFYAFVILSVFAYLQAQVQAGPVTLPEKADDTPAAVTGEKKDDTPATVSAEKKDDAENAAGATDYKNDDIDDDLVNEINDNENDMDEPDFESQSPAANEHETSTTSNTSHLFNSTPEGSQTSATPNLDAFMRAFEAIDQNVYNEIETFLENIVPKLPENNNPITNHLESAVFLFELYEKMKEPRDLNNSQEQHFLGEIENFLASNSFLLFNKPTGGRQELEDELAADQEGDEQNQEFELNDDIQDNNNFEEEATNDEDDDTPAANKDADDEAEEDTAVEANKKEDELKESKPKESKPQEATVVAA